MSPSLAVLALLAAGAASAAEVPVVEAAPAPAEAPSAEPAPPAPSDAPLVERTAPSLPPEEEAAPVEPPRRYRSNCDACPVSPLMSSGGELAVFASKVASEPEFAALGEELVTRHNRSRVYLLGGTGLGAGLAVLGFFVLPESHCGFTERGYQDCRNGFTNYATAGVGVLSALVGTLAYYATRPTDGEFLDVVNRWNAEHPDSRYTPDKSGGYDKPQRLLAPRDR